MKIWKKIDGEYHEYTMGSMNRKVVETEQSMWKEDGYKAKILKGKRGGRTHHRLYIRNDKMKRYNHPDSYYKQIDKKTKDIKRKKKEWKVYTHY